jgi:mRNA interferase RelE/StbE
MRFSEVGKLEAADRIRTLHPQVKHKIRLEIKELLVSPLNGHTLQFELAGLRSYRIRTYRIIYRLNDDESCLDIVFVGPHRNVYEELRTLLLTQRGDKQISLFATLLMPYRLVRVTSHSACPSHPPLPSDCFAIDFPERAIRPGGGLPIPHTSL